MGKKDIRLMIEDVKFGARAVGVINKNNKILFQKRKQDEYWALPGGAIEVLERAKDVVVRELEEEIGHSINKEEIEGIEEGKNIIYKWIDIEELKDAKIKPEFLKEKLLNIKEQFEFIEA